jgi:hypothetical protein
LLVSLLWIRIHRYRLVFQTITSASLLLEKILDEKAQYIYEGLPVPRRSLHPYDGISNVADPGSGAFLTLGSGYPGWIKKIKIQIQVEHL